MELRHLRHFVTVAEELHFARAAERLGMEQSPPSHSVRNLEGELGIRLFQRTTQRTWLTRAGIRFYREARRILRDIDAAAAAAKRDDVEERLGRLIRTASRSPRCRLCSSGWAAVRGRSTASLYKPTRSWTD